MVTIDVRPHRSWLTRAPAAVGIAAALLLAACSSSGGSGGGTASNGSTASGGASSGSTASGDTTTSSAAAGLKVAAAAVAKYSALPTTLPFTQPLGAAPAKGKYVVMLQCEVQQCADGGNGFRAAAAAVGWKTKTLNWKSTDPASLVADLQQALTLKPKPYAVSLSGLPQAIWAGQEAAYAKAGVLLIPWSMGPVKLSKTIIANIQAPQDVEFQGKLLGDWFIVDSKGKGKVLQQDVPQFPSIAEGGSGFRNEVAAQCPGCKVTTLNVTGTQIAANGVTPAIVSALQRDPSIQYVDPSDIGLAPGLPAALKAAGLSRIKIIGGEGTAVDQQDVRDGKISVTVQNDQTILGWQMIDVLVRQAAGLKFPSNDGGLIYQLQTKANMPAAGTLVPAGYPDQFKKLWRVA